METKEYPYKAGTKSCVGYFAYPTAVEKPPIVVIAPTWEGVNHFAKDMAHSFVNMGYGALVADLYGEGKAANSQEEAASLMKPLFIDRALLRERILAACHEAKKIEVCDSTRIAAVGFCFGGLTVIELMKTGIQLNGIVSFHGLLGDELMGNKAVLACDADQINTTFLLLHGYKDPLVPMQDVINLQKELNKRNVDWQTHIYGTAAHAFTNPEAHDKNAGMYFDKKSCLRSMKTMHNYLKEIFNE